MTSYDVSIRHELHRFAKRFVMWFVIPVTTLAIAASIAQAADPIKIGSVLSLTGPASYLGSPMQQSVEMAIDEMNSKGGILGRKIELVQYDDESDAGKANAFVKRLIDDDKVDAIVAGNTSGSALAMIPIAERAGVPFVAVAGSAAIIDPVKKWIFKTPPTDRVMAQRVLDELHRDNLNKLALLTETGAYGQSARKVSQELAERMHIPVVADETFAPKDSDITPQLSKIKASGAQAIFVVGSGAGPAIATRNAAQLGMKIRIYQGGGAGSDEFIKLTGQAAEGVYVLGPAVIAVDELPDSDKQKPIALAYSNSFRTRYKSSPNTFGASAYDAVLFVREGMLNAKSTDKEKVRASIESIHDLVGAQGIYNLSPTNHLGLSPESIRIFQIHNGKFMPVTN